MSTGERGIRWSTIAAVTAVAFVAGWVSYEHALTVVEAHGETGALGHLYPFTIDGLIFAASMALLDAARRRKKAPALARWMLAAGIVVTLAMNVLAGIAHGPLGAAVGAWPAAALVGSYELLMVIIRGATAAPANPAPVVERTPTPAVPVPGGAPESAPVPVPAKRTHRAAGAPPATARTRAAAAPGAHLDAAEMHFAADLAAGRVPSLRAIKAELHVGQPRAQEIFRHLTAVTTARPADGPAPTAIRDDEPERAAS
jgi:hypothetical protein